VYKDEELIETLNISSKTEYSFGRNPKQVDIALEHSSLSRRHAGIFHGTPSGDFGASIVDFGSCIF
jgi:hypothetical protein